MPDKPYHVKLEDLPKESLLDGRVQRTALLTDNGMSVAIWLEKGPAGEPHRHPFDQLTYILSGQVRVTIDDEEFLLSAGEAIYIPANALHGGEVLSDERVLNIDVFSPPREDYMHLVQHQLDALDADA